MSFLIPVGEPFRRFGPQQFANETQLQEFFEKRAAPLCGLRIVSSSEHGHKFGKIDATALDASNSPVIIEYKPDVINDATVAQLRQYDRWWDGHREAFAKTVLRRFKCRVPEKVRPQLVAIGYRLKLSKGAAGAHGIRFTRYGYFLDGCVWLREVNVANRSEWGDEPSPRFSKDDYLPNHLAKTTPAAGAAFERLRALLVAAGFNERIHGKNRMTYRHPVRANAIELTFTDVAVQCFFTASPPVDVHDRVRAVEVKNRSVWTCGLVSESDVPPVARLLGVTVAD